MNLPRALSKIVHLGSEAQRTSNDTIKETIQIVFVFE